LLCCHGKQYIATDLQNRLTAVTGRPDAPYTTSNGVQEVSPRRDSSFVPTGLAPSPARFAAATMITFLIIEQLWY
jgi:hypothetical protein